jgi:hypothetical protein
MQPPRFALRCPDSLEEMQGRTGELLLLAFNTSQRSGLSTPASLVILVINLILVFGPYA